MKKLIFFLFLSLQLSAQEFSVQKGVVVDGFKVSDTLEESYALYLPTSYQNGKAWPVIYVFDGEGRGKTAAQLFRPAAEEQGYIIVSSNNTFKQNTLEENILIASRLLQQSTQVLPIDTSQVFTAGSMAGAKAATSLPLIFPDIEGVIAVGDHWINFDLIDKNVNFSFVGIVGDEQYSASGINLTANALSRMKFPSEVYTYDGGQDWPNPEIIKSAVGFLTMNAMREKLRPVEPQLIETLYSQDLARVNKLMSLNQLLNADGLLSIMEDKYDGFLDNSEVETRQNQLARSRNFIQQKREHNAIVEKENRLINDFIFYLEDDIATANFTNLGWWNYQKKQLDSLSQRKNEEAKMAVRLKGFITEYVRLKRNELQKARTPLESKLMANMIQTIFDPQAFDAYKNIISLSAIDNDYETAFFYLEEMLKHGFEDMQALYKIEGTLGLRLTPQYNHIIEKYLGESKFHDSPGN